MHDERAARPGGRGCEAARGRRRRGSRRDRRRARRRPWPTVSYPRPSSAYATTSRSSPTTIVGLPVESDGSASAPAAASAAARSRPLSSTPPTVTPGRTRAAAAAPIATESATASARPDEERGAEADGHGTAGGPRGHRAHEAARDGDGGHDDRGRRRVRERRSLHDRATRSGSRPGRIPFDVPPRIQPLGSGQAPRRWSGAIVAARARSVEWDPWPLLGPTGYTPTSAARSSGVRPRCNRPPAEDPTWQERPEPGRARARPPHSSACASHSAAAP